MCREGKKACAFCNTLKQSSICCSNYTFNNDDTTSPMKPRAVLWQGRNDSSKRNTINTWGNMAALCLRKFAITSYWITHSSSDRSTVHRIHFRIKGTHDKTSQHWLVAHHGGTSTQKNWVTKPTREVKKAVCGAIFFLPGNVQSFHWDNVIRFLRLQH